MHSGAYIGAYTNMLLLHYDSTRTQSRVFLVFPLRFAMRQEDGY
jgi:hypothetical protein